MPKDLQKVGLSHKLPTALSQQAKLCSKPYGQENVPTKAFQTKSRLIRSDCAYLISSKVFCLIEALVRHPQHFFLITPFVRVGSYSHGYRDGPFRFSK